ncbi:MAG: hypothetical protein ACR2JB_06750 [Bryobacteraceae bacterium]
MKRYNVIAITLIAFGAISLVFGWPWGSLVGAILILAGVIAVRSRSQAPPTSESAQEMEASKTPSPPSANAMAEATTLQNRIAESQARGEPVPQEYYDRLSVLAKEGLEKIFRGYDAVLAQKGDQLADLSEFARDLRERYHWPTTGSVLGLPNAEEMTAFALSRIEALGGKLPLREATAMIALSGDDGAERHYMHERLKRGWPSMFANDKDLPWRDKLGFYERYLKQRHNNVLFKPLQRCVSLYDLHLARQVDDKERADFLQAMKETLDLFAGPDQVHSSRAKELMEALFDLLGKSPTIYDSDDLRKSIREGYQATVDQVLISYHNDDPESAKKLRELEENRWSLAAVTQHPSVAFLLRIPNEFDFTPALLTEPADIIGMLATTFGDSILDGPRAEVKTMLNESPEIRNHLRFHRQHLSVLGISI